MAAPVTTTDTRNSLTRRIYAIEEAVIQHHAAIQKAKTAWRSATHPSFRPSPEEIDMANEAFRIAYNASLRVYLKTIRDLDDER